MTRCRLLLTSNVRWFFILVAVTVTLAEPQPLALAEQGGRWVGVWATSPVAPLSPSTKLPWGPPPKREFENQTLRQIVHISLGGRLVRIRLSNQYGTEPLQVGKSYVALRRSGSSILPESNRPVTYGGQPAVRIPPGAVAWSDPVALEVKAATDLAVSVYLPDAVREVTWHPSAFQTSYVSATGDFAADTSLADETTVSSWYFLTGVAVSASPGAGAPNAGAPDAGAPNAGAPDAGAIVAFGDSITDGAKSTSDTNRRWPDVLAARLRAAGKPLSVLNAGIGGNRILHDGRGGFRTLFGVSALARFNSDVLDQPGVGHVIVLLGINDIGHVGSPDVAASEDVSADEIIAGLRQLVARAHTHGLRIFGATLTPFEGTEGGYYTPEKETKRQAVNRWIRTGSAFDGVIDFDRAVRDPNHPARFLPSYDSGDHLHPGDAGLEAMGKAVELSLF